MMLVRLALFLYAILLVVASKMAVLVETVRGPLSRAYRNSRIWMRGMRKSEITRSSRRMIHNTTSEVYHSSSMERDVPVFKNKAIDDVFWRMANYGPAFSVVPDDITFLKEPCDYYQALLAGVARAKRRIVFASLYLGSSKLETDLIDAIHTALGKNSNLEVTFLLDCMRGKRGGKVPTGPKDMPKEPAKSSLKLLHPTMQQYPDRVKINLYHTPDLRGIMKKILPNTYNEGLGVSHIKAYIFDDDILISGANLSHDYFTNRQDRFCLIKNHASLTNYFHGIIDVIGSFSNVMNAEGEVVLADKEIDFEKDHINFRQFAKQKIEPFLQPRTFYSTSSKTPMHKLGQHLPDMESLLQKKTWIFPSLQMAPLHVRHDEVLTDLVLANNHRLYLASPYLNLTKNYTNQILKQTNPVDIITCSPEANGWYKAKGLASSITAMYTHIERKFYEFLQEKGQLGRVNLHEYVRDDWTFHSKGLWAVLPGQELPYLTTIGSPNFGGRSVEKDLEAQAFILTEDPTLMAKIEEERQYLFNDAVKVDEDVLNHPKRKVNTATQLLAKAGSNFL